MFGELTQFRQRSHVTIHTKETVGHQKLATSRFLLQRTFQTGQIIMAINPKFGTGKPATIDEAGMIPAIAIDHVFRSRQRHHGSEIRRHAGRKQDRRWCPFEPGQPLFQPRMQVGSPRHQGTRFRPDSMGHNRILGRSNNSRVVCQTQIIVRGEVPGFDPIDQQTARSMGRDFSAGTEQPFLRELLQFVRQPVEKITHRRISPRERIRSEPIVSIHGCIEIENPFPK